MIESSSSSPTSSTDASCRVALVSTQWHHELLKKCQEGFFSAWLAAGMDREFIDVHEVPGAFELPLRCKQLALSGRYGALVTLGLITDGAIYRHDFVASSVNQGLMQVQLETGVPIVLSVMTPQRSPVDELAQVFMADHLRKKGVEAAATSLWALRSIMMGNQSPNKDTSAMLLRRPL